MEPCPYCKDGVDCRDKYIANYASMAVNQWLHYKGDTVDKYLTYLDRVSELWEVIEEAIVKADKARSVYHPGD